MNIAQTFTLAVSLAFLVVAMTLAARSRAERLRRERLAEQRESWAMFHEKVSKVEAEIQQYRVDAILDRMRANRRRRERLRRIGRRFRGGMTP